MAVGYTNYLGVNLPGTEAYTKQIWATGTNALYGPNTPTYLAGSNQGNAIYGGSAGDTLIAMHVKDVLSGGGGVDTAFATVDFTLPNDIENLSMNSKWSPVMGVGNNNANILIAENGGHGVSLNGKGGADVFVGSTSSDTFIFQTGSGQDTITNFQTGTDVVRIEGYALDSFAKVKAAMTQQGSDVVLKLSSTDLIEFQNTTVGAFTARDFQLPAATSSMKLTFADEFDTLKLQQLGQGGWSAVYPWDRYDTLSAHTISGEAQVYVDPTTKGLGINPFSVSNGVLTITAANTTSAQKSALWNYDYTSGLITTKDTFAQTYGYFEMRADLPHEKGVFPAFWLLPQDESYDSELDIMETVNGVDQVYNTIHTPAGGPGQGFNVTIPNLTDGFHTFGVLWTKDKITWYVDGTAVNSAATPAAMNKPMYMLANLAVGGSWAGAPNKAEYPAEMKIDYIRAYSLDGAPVSQAPTAPTTPTTPTAPAPTTPTTTGPTISIKAEAGATTEGDAGDTYALFTVTRTGDLSKATTADWKVAGFGSAQATASDFKGGVLPADKVYFGQNESTKTIWVPIAGDKTAEANEGFSVTLSNVTGGTIGTATATSIITNDDGTPPVTTTPTTPTTPTPTGSGPSISIKADAAATIEGNAGDAYALFTVTRTGDLSKATTADWKVAGFGSAQATASDFKGGVLPADKVYFGQNESTKTIWVPIAGDKTAEANEGFSVTLSNVTGGTIGTATATSIITNDDGTPPVTTTPTTPTTPTPAPTTGTPVMSITTAGQMTTEGQSGISYAVYTVTRSGDLKSASTVQWSVQGDGADPASASDFQGGVLPKSTLSFGGGEATKEIWVPILGDKTVEADEGYKLSLSAPTNGVIGTGSVTGVIWNDDTSVTSVAAKAAPTLASGAAALSIAAKTTGVVESDSGVQYVLFDVTRTGNLDKASSATWSVAGAGATPASASDFEKGVLPSSTVYFGQGESLKTIWVPVLGDKTVEADEGFRVTLSGASGATILGDHASGVIFNNDMGVLGVSYTPSAFSL